MEIETFRHALNLGLGRTILHLRRNPWKPYAQLIEYVCLHNTAYDAQCEGSRAGYVFEIINLTDALPHFADIISAGLLDAHEHWDTCHLFDLAALCAKSGHARAREAIYEKLRRHNAQQRFTGAAAAVQVDGISGLLFAADQIGSYLAANPDAWVDEDLLRESRAILGVDPEPQLRQQAPSNPGIRRFLEGVDQHRNNSRPQSKPDYQSLSFDELKAMIIAKNGAVPRGWLFGWGRHATDQAIASAAAELLNETDENRRLAYLRIFNRRAFPLDPQPLIHLAQSANADVTFAAIRALSHIQHAPVRQLGLALMGGTQTAYDAIQLFAKNLAPGDERRIEALLDQTTDEDNFHALAHDAVNVFQNNPQADALASMLAIYEQCRCGLCRHTAVKILMAQQIIPGWMLEECQYDSLGDIRETVCKFTPPPKPIECPAKPK